MFSPFRSPRYLLAFVLACALISSAGCSNVTNNGTGPTVKGSGVIKTEDRTVANFSEIILTGGSEVFITQGESESLSIEADDNILAILVSEVKNGRLTFSYKDGQNVAPTKLVIRLGVKALSVIEISGDAKLSAGALTSKNLDLRVTGACDCTLEGTADSFRVDVAGRLTLLGKTLRTREAFVDVRGMGQIALSVSDRLDVKYSGAGTLTYFGDPQITQNITGAGNIVKGS